MVEFSSPNSNSRAGLPAAKAEAAIAAERSERMGQKQNTEIRQEESPEEVRESIETGEIVILEIGSADGAPGSEHDAGGA